MDFLISAHVFKQFTQPQESWKNQIPVLYLG